MEARLEKPLLLAALLTIPAIVFDTTPVGTVLGWVTWLTFVLEAVLMLRLVDDRRAWLREHPLEIAIIILTPPLLPASLQAARVFRLLRLLRLIRLGIIVRRLFSTEGIRDAGVLAAMTVLGGGTAYAYVEEAQDLSTWDGVWWAITTVTTVGYGDSFPTTDAGRVIAIVVMFVGIGFVAILTAAAAERFLRTAPVAELQELRDRVQALEAERGLGQPGTTDK